MEVRILHSEPSGEEQNSQKTSRWSKVWLLGLPFLGGLVGGAIAGPAGATAGTKLMLTGVGSTAIKAATFTAGIGLGTLTGRTISRWSTKPSEQAKLKTKSRSSFALTKELSLVRRRHSHPLDARFSEAVESIRCDNSTMLPSHRIRDVLIGHLRTVLIAGLDDQRTHSEHPLGKLLSLCIVKYLDRNPPIFPCSERADSKIEDLEEESDLIGNQQPSDCETEAFLQSIQDLRLLIEHIVGTLLEYYPFLQPNETQEHSSPNSDNAREIHYIAACQEAVELVLLEHVYSALFSHFEYHYSVEDEALHSSLLLIRSDITLDELGVSPKLHSIIADHLEEWITEFDHISRAVTAWLKLEGMVYTVQRINNELQLAMEIRSKTEMEREIVSNQGIEPDIEVEGKRETDPLSFSIGADDLVPIICFVLANSSITNLTAHMGFIREFGEEMIDRDGKIEYVFTTFQAAFEVLSTLSLRSSDLHRSERRQSQ